MFFLLLNQHTIQTVFAFPILRLSGGRVRVGRQPVDLRIVFADAEGVRQVGERIAWLPGLDERGRELDVDAGIIRRRVERALKRLCRARVVARGKGACAFGGECVNVECAPAPCRGVIDLLLEQRELALPALRLRGLYMALATLAFAALMDSIFFTNPSNRSSLDEAG